MIRYTTILFILSFPQVSGWRTVDDKTLLPDDKAATHEFQHYVLQDTDADRSMRDFFFCLVVCVESGTHGFPLCFRFAAVNSSHTNVGAHDQF